MGEFVFDKARFRHSHQVVSRSLHRMVLFAQRMQIGESSEAAPVRVIMVEGNDVVDL